MAERRRLWRRSTRFAVAPTRGAAGHLTATGRRVRVRAEALADDPTALDDTNDHRDAPLAAGRGLHAGALGALARPRASRRVTDVAHAITLSARGHGSCCHERPLASSSTSHEGVRRGRATRVASEGAWRDRHEGVVST